MKPSKNGVQQTSQMGAPVFHSLKSSAYLDLNRGWIQQNPTKPSLLGSRHHKWRISHDPTIYIQHLFVFASLNEKTSGVSIFHITFWVSGCFVLIIFVGISEIFTSWRLHILGSSCVAPTPLKLEAWRVRWSDGMEWDGFIWNDEVFSPVNKHSWLGNPKWMKSMYRTY